MSTDPTLSRASDPDATGLPEQPDARGPVGGDAGAQEGPISWMLVRASPSFSSRVAPVRRTVSSIRKSTSLASMTELRSPSVHCSSERSRVISAWRSKTSSCSIIERDSRVAEPLVLP